MFKKILILLFTILITNCGYSPIYNNNIDQNIEITILSIEGDEHLNKKLNTELKKYIKENSENSFKVKINTNYVKKTISKNSKGNATNFELIASATFTIVLDDYEKKILLNENLKIKNKEDSFEQQKYEDIIIANFAKSLKQKLLLQLNNF